MAASKLVTFIATAVYYLATGTKAASLADIDHVVLFMQENRAFDHYFGTMPGVRGFADANLQMNGNRTIWEQKVNAKLTTEADHVNPWYLNYLGGTWPEATQCMYAASNSWTPNHKAYAKGLNNQWAIEQNPWSLGFYKSNDIPMQWALADGWVVGDMYQESVVASTSPNRATWVSGSINAPGGPQKPDQGGNPYIDNNETPGCEAGGINCYPLRWKTAGEFYEDAGVSWMVYQDADNFDDNPYAWFEQFQKAPQDSPLYQKGMKGDPLKTFYERAANGTLPAVSYIVGPAALSEHPPYTPNDGAAFQKQIAEAVINSPAYSKTALIVSYDETGGWYDHLIPIHAPDGTAGEWINDPWAGQGRTFTGPGFRVPFYIISPYTRHGGVYTEHSDHNSQMLFVEKWQEAKGNTVLSNEMVPWRRENMGDLTAAFDFENPDFSRPKLPDVPAAAPGSCENKYKTTRPPVPYKGKGVIDDLSTVVEHGFKTIRGKLTEGRYLVLEQNGVALTGQKCTSGIKIHATPATPKHDKKAQRWVVHALKIGGDDFTLSCVAGDAFFCDDGTLCKDKSKAVVFTVGFTPSKGYSFKVKGTGKYLSLGRPGDITLDGSESQWKVFSVNY